VPKSRRAQSRLLWEKEEKESQGKLSKGDNLRMEIGASWAWWVPPVILTTWEAEIPSLETQSPK
jgi:hypothetical protein